MASKKHAPVKPAPVVAPPPVIIPESEPVVSPVVEPVIVEAIPVGDAGVALYVDRAGPPINTGLTEGSSNFATITAEARRSVLP